MQTLPQRRRNLQRMQEIDFGGKNLNKIIYFFIVKQILYLHNSNNKIKII